MNVHFNYLREDKVIRYGFSISGALLLISILIPILLFHLLPPFLPLYNKLPWGYARLGTKMEFFIPLGIAIFYYFCNIFLAQYLYKKIPLLARLLCATTIVIMLLVNIFVIQTIRITTF